MKKAQKKAKNHLYSVDETIPRFAQFLSQTPWIRPSSLPIGFSSLSPESSFYVADDASTRRKIEKKEKKGGKERRVPRRFGSLFRSAWQHRHSHTLIINTHGGSLVDCQGLTLDLFLSTSMYSCMWILMHEGKVAPWKKKREKKTAYSTLKRLVISQTDYSRGLKQVYKKKRRRCTL